MSTPSCSQNPVYSREVIKTGKFSANAARSGCPGPGGQSHFCHRPGCASRPPLRRQPGADPEGWAGLSPRPGAPWEAGGWGEAGVRTAMKECLPSGQVDVHPAGFIGHLGH